MRRVLAIAFMAMICTGLFAEGKKEAVKSWTGMLTWISPGVLKYPDGEKHDYDNVYSKVAGDLEKKYPGLKVQVLTRDVTKGSMTVDAMMAAGTPPDVWTDASGYFTKYLNADYALPLEKYLDIGIYQKDLLDIYVRDGHQYAIPQVNIAGGFAINLDMLDAIGYKMPALEGWTTDEFLSLAARLQAKKIPTTMIMGKGGLHTWNNVWLFAFGGEFFRNKDYTKTVVNSAQSLAALAYIKKLIDNGYAYPNPVEVNDDDGVELFTTNKVFSCMMQNGHTDYWVPEQLKNKKIDKEISVTFVEVPHAPGRAHTPVYGYQTVSVGHASKDEEKNKLVAELLGASISKEVQNVHATVAGGFPSLIGFAPASGAAAKIGYKAISKLSATAGLMDEFPRGDIGAAAGRLWATMSEQWLRGKLSAEAFLKEYEIAANKILASK